MSKPARKQFTEAERELVRRNYADTSTKDLATACECSIDSVYQLARRMGLKKSETYLASEAACRLRRGDEVGKRYRFPKGHVPANKGVKHEPGWAPGNMAKTQFKPGETPRNWVPVGSYRLARQGSRKDARKILEYKFAETAGPYTNRWIPVHRKVWIEANGTVPEGHVIAFKPGRYTTDLALITPDALECISRLENIRRNSIQALPPEIAQVHRLRGALTRAINRRGKEQDE